MKYFLIVLLFCFFLTAEDNTSTNEWTVSSQEFVQDLQSSPSKSEQEPSDLSTKDLEFLFEQELSRLSNMLSEQDSSDSTQDSIQDSVEGFSVFPLLDNDTSFSLDSSSEWQVTPYERDIFDSPWYGRNLYHSNWFCRYPYWNRSCFYGVPVFGLQMTFKKRKNARQQYQEYLFDQAYRGSVRAPFILGVRYKEGFGFSKNISQAYAWFFISLQRGYSPAQYMINKLEAEMTQAQMSASETTIHSIVSDSKKAQKERFQLIQDFQEVN